MVAPSPMGMMIFHLLIANNIIKKIAVFRSDLVFWGYSDPAMSSLFGM